jgi:hypothetical protein
LRPPLWQTSQEIEEEINHGNFKKAFPLALELSKETYSNAKSLYLLGKSSLGIGDLKLARESLQKASVFDCSNWRGNDVYNAIIKKLAKTKQLPLIDFDQYMSTSLTKEGLFMDEIFPQNIFYEAIMQDLKEVLNKILSVNN